MPSESIDDLARWFVAHAVKTDEVTASASRALFQVMRESSNGPERAAAESAVAWEGDAESLAHWLATQILSLPKLMPKVKAAKICLMYLLEHGSPVERRAVEHALIWMVLHTRPVKLLSRNRRRTLLAEPDEEGTDWAAHILDGDVIRPLLQRGRWWHRCRFAQSKFGFDFADEGINFLWERIEKYRLGTSGFETWLEAVLSNYWRSLHRKWKRDVPKHSKIAAELDRLLDEDGLRRVTRTPGERSNGSPPLASTNPFATTRTWALLTAADLAVLNRWSPLDRVLFGLETGVWRQLPPDLWNDWLRRAGIKGWESEAPMGELTPAQCRLVVSRMTKIKPAALTKRWQRLRPAIASLPSISRLIASRQEM